jgi:CheY-like chemotaxis protein
MMTTEMSLPPAPTERDDQAESPIRALVAEDNDDLRLVMTMRLQMMGVEVTPAVNGEEAVAHAQAADDAGHPFDLILMDMEMPIVDGYEATRRLRKQGHLGPILAMTAHDPSEIGDCRRFGCDGYVGKPIDWNKLGATIKESVGRS